MAAPKMWLSLFQGPGVKAQLVRGAAGVGILKLMSLPLGIVTSVILARVLGPEGYGQYAFIVSAISILSLPFGSGLGQLISREVAKYHHAGEWKLFKGLIRRVNQWSFVGSILIALTVAGIALSQTNYQINDRWTLFLVAVFQIPLLGLIAVRSSMLRGLRRVFYAQLPELLIQPGLHLMIIGFLIISGFLNTVSTLLALEAATFCAFLLGSWLVKFYYPKEARSVRPDYRHGEWWAALLPMTLLAAVGTFNGQIGILLLGWLGSDEDVAALRLATSGAGLVVLSQTIINLVIGPYITRAWRDNDKVQLQRLSRQSARAALLFSLPIAFPLIFMGEEFVGFIYGDVYVDSVPLPLTILCIGQLVNVGVGSVGMFLTMTGFEKDTLKGHMVALIVNVTAAIFLIPILGANGAALAVALGLVTWNVLLAVRLFQRVGIRPLAF